MLNKIRDLLQNKANKPSRRARQPLDREGVEGDFVITRLKDGIFVFFKVMSKWLKIFHSASSLVPDRNKAYDLGSQTRRWKNLYLSNDAIYIGDTKELAGKISYDGTDLLFKNKAGAESKIVGKRADSSVDSNAGNTIVLGSDNASNEHGFITLGSGSSYYGGLISGMANLAELGQSAYLGLRVLSNSSDAGDTSAKALCIVDTFAITDPKLYLATHDNSGGHIGIKEHATAPAAVADMGILYAKTDGLYYITDGISATNLVADQYSVMIAGINYNLSAGTHAVIPLSGATRPFTAFTGVGETTTFVAPFDGALQRVMYRSEETSGLSGVSIKIGLHEAANGTEVPTMTPECEVEITSVLAGDISAELDFSGVAHNSLTKGNIYGFTIDPSYDINDAIFTFVIKYDVTT